MAQNDTNFRWTKARTLAAQLLADDELSDEEVAEKVGISRTQLSRWKRHEVFQARLQSITADMGSAALRRAIAKRGRRVQAVEDRWFRMQQVIAERAAAPEMQNVPGGKTGLICHNVKGVGKGDNFQLIDLYEVDTALLKELREHEKQAAVELGQWSEKKDLTTAGQPFKLYAGFNPEDV